MTLTRFGKLCLGLPGATMVVQWGGSHVFKVGGKMFALGHHTEAGASFVFKATPLSFAILLEQRQATRAPYLRRGNWVMVPAGGGMPDAELRSYIVQSYQTVTARLSQAARQRLGDASF